MILFLFLNNLKQPLPNPSKTYFHKMPYFAFFKIFVINIQNMHINNSVISREIRTLAALYPPPHTKKCFNIGLRSRVSLLISGGGMLMPTAFAPLSIVSV